MHGWSLLKKEFTFKLSLNFFEIISEIETIKSIAPNHIKGRGYLQSFV